MPKLPPIYNSLDSTSLDVIAPMSPHNITHIEADGVNRETYKYTESFVRQFNASASSHHGITVVDLADHITDIVIETVAQGAGTLTVSVIDPAWSLLTGDTPFLSVDDNGYLYPPIEINFPEDVSDAKWRLCTIDVSTDTTQANLQLTFEDAIVSELRDHDNQTDPSLAQSNPNETRAEFIRRCVKTATSSNSGTNTYDIGATRFIPLLPNSVFTPADLYGDTTSVPTSAKEAGRNYLKKAATSNAAALKKQAQAEANKNPVKEIVMGVTAPLDVIGGVLWSSLKPDSTNGLSNFHIPSS